MGSFLFKKKERLLKRRDFVNLNRSGKRYHSRHFIAILKHNGLGHTRLGITAGKRAGNAVKRNRIKRLIREFFRLNKLGFPLGYDIVISAKKNASSLDFQKIKDELSEVIFDRKFIA